ncbi:OPT oligopeptide transporter protein domain-containing protein [Trichoderma breve]|uniref:OPT oligopeptide transporter protein domain-containing protein n=1 Tax=Trichoderma breve TaxID=2034170 RepID=A0A9W9E6T7_9HYPO|nr:OPT oligopeptide transporter protein domain-containing protein [Trichoderma breve]KAJ4859625.1 OPT oligopeptide transporter protein domain-containing protein [Trichoderma breve]
MSDDEKAAATGGVAEMTPNSSRPSIVDDGIKDVISEPFSYDEDDRDYYSPQNTTEHDLNVTEDDLLEAQELASRYTLQEVRDIMTRVFRVHEKDHNFPSIIIQKIKAFLENESVFSNPEKHQHLIQEMKLEAALVTSNSPYAEVRAVVSNKDDPTTPCSTIRSWVIGLAFSCLLAFINQLFDIRQPAIRVMANVAQLLSYPVGKACENWLPDVGFTLFGTYHSLNPGPFSKKEHMLITIMANYLPQYFNQPYASHVAYQLLIALATNFIGYGMAGICRRFLVYPSYCVWPASLVTIALNKAFHNESNAAVEGPFGKKWKISRIKFFYLMFNWLTWIAPHNRDLNVITGINHGLGVNPFPTFDWNVLLWDSADPLMVPFYSTLNRFFGVFISFWVVLAFWYSNVYDTGYLPINSNRVYDHFGKLYNISRAVDDRGLFHAEEYKAYSPPFLSAGNIVIYMFFFAIYTSTLTYAVLYHRHEIVMGFKSLFASFRKKKNPIKDERVLDVHNRLMKAYPEVPEWWYLICLVLAIALGVAGIAGWNTNTSPGVVFYGLALCIIFVIPVGIIKAMTGIEVTLNVLAEFIGGSFVDGNALAMNYFKSFGYVTCAHAVWFCNDLKLAHYVKIPPRQTFIAQIIATFISTVICTGVLNFQMKSITGVCTPDAQFKLTCPGVNTFFTASVLWGTVGPQKIFGHSGQYTEILVGFPLGIVVVVFFWGLNKKFPKWTWTRQIHPVAIMYGGITRFVSFWSKYNFVLSAAWSCGIAISGIIIFFALQYTDVQFHWWGNMASDMGCEGKGCTLKHLAPGEYFGPRMGTFD